MSDMMTFPDTWEEFEKLYGFNDVEEIYTNNSRLIPSFRVKQWLDHLPSVQQEQLDCEDCIKHGGDWECDRVHCHKGDDPDTNVGELISRQAAIDFIDAGHLVNPNEPRWSDNEVVNFLKSRPSAQPERYTKEELRVFQHGISLSLLSKRSAQHWRYDEDTATEIKFLERLYEKVGADMRGEQDDSV